MTLFESIYENAKKLKENCPVIKRESSLEDIKNIVSEIRDEIKNKTFKIEGNLKNTGFLNQVSRNPDDEQLLFSYVYYELGKLTGDTDDPDGLIPNPQVIGFVDNWITTNLGNIAQRRLQDSNGLSDAKEEYLNYFVDQGQDPKSDLFIIVLTIPFLSSFSTRVARKLYIKVTQPKDNAPMYAFSFHPVTHFINPDDRFIKQKTFVRKNGSTVTSSEFARKIGMKLKNRYNAMIDEGDYSNTKEEYRPVKISYYLAGVSDITFFFEHELTSEQKNASFNILKTHTMATGGGDLDFRDTHFTYPSDGKTTTYSIPLNGDKLEKRDNISKNFYKNINMKFSDKQISDLLDLYKKEDIRYNEVKNNFVHPDAKILPLDELCQKVVERFDSEAKHYPYEIKDWRNFKRKWDASAVKEKLEAKNKKDKLDTEKKENTPELTEEDFNDILDKPEEDN